MWSVMAWCGKRFPSMCGVNCSWSASATTVGGWDGASTVCWLLFAAICCKFLCSSTSAFLWFRRSISVFVFGVSVQSTKSLFCAVVAGPCPKFNCCIVMWHYVCRVLHLAWVCWCHLLVWRLGNSALWASVATLLPSSSWLCWTTAGIIGVCSSVSFLWLNCSKFEVFFLKSKLTGTNL